MAKRSSKKLTKYVSATTIVTAETANKWFGGLYGSPEGDVYETDDPVVAGHVHDGLHQDGHAQKVDLVSHVTGKLQNSKIADGAINTRTIARFSDQEDAIPESIGTGINKKYLLDLSEVRSDIDDVIADFAFVRDSGVVSNKTGNLATNDFVFGSETLGNTGGNTDWDSRFLFDKDKAAFRAGLVEGDEWSLANRGDYSAAFGKNNTASGGYSFVGAGESNLVSGNHSAVFAGAENQVSKDYATILNGQDNAIEEFADYSVALGRGAIARSYGEVTHSSFGTDGLIQSSTLLFYGDGKSITSNQIILSLNNSGEWAYAPNSVQIYATCQVFVLNRNPPLNYVSYGFTQSITLDCDGSGVITAPTGMGITNPSSKGQVTDLGDVTDWQVDLHHPSANRWSIKLTTSSSDTDKRNILCVCRLVQIRNGAAI